jgi:hypothetical protein
MATAMKTHMADHPEWWPTEQLKGNMNWSRRRGAAEFEAK